MANEKKGSTGIRYDDFVKIVKPDLGSTEQVVLLHGYVGESSTEDMIRLYSDASLSEYADVAKSDILYSLPNDDDPLGGSRLWVKQTANVNYADAYSQGDMYNNYMNDQYTPGAEAMGAASQFCTISPLTRTAVCRPTRFVCPTPVSKLVICTLPKKTLLACPIPTKLSGCPNPSWVDGCPSQWGCTIQTGTTVINPGGQFGDEYAGGDVYNDYLQNTYEGDGSEEFGIQPTIVQPTVITTTRTITIRRTVPLWQCWRPTRNAPWCPPVTCHIGTIRPTKWPSLACTTQQTTTIQTGTTIINPGGGGQFGDDYTGGDVYNDYMENAYDGGAEEFGGGGITNNQICMQQISANCVTRNFVCPSRLVIQCFTRQAGRCITRQQQRSICRPCIPVTTTIRTTTMPSAVDGCPSQWGCTIQTGTTVINPGVGQYGDDYSGGDVYNDYMQNTYDGGGAEAFGGGAATSPQLCLHRITQVGCQPSQMIVCQVTRPNVCRISVPINRCPIRTLQRSICRPCIPVTTTRTFPSAVDGCPSQFGCPTDITTTRTFPTDVTNPGGIGGGGFNDYGY